MIRTDYCWTIAKLRCFGATKSLQVDHIEEEFFKETTLLDTFWKNGTVWKSEFERVEKIEDECVIVTPGFPNNAV